MNEKPENVAWKSEQLGTQSARAMTPREKLLHEIKAAKDVNLRRLVALQGLEEKINRMGEYDCEVVQTFQELIAEATR